MRFNDLQRVLDHSVRSVPTYARPQQSQHSSRIAMSFSTLCCSAHTTKTSDGRLCCRAGKSTVPYRMDMLLCCVSRRDGTRRSCRLPRYSSSITTSGGFPRCCLSQTSKYWHMCRNGDKGRRVARQWDLSIRACPTGGSVLRVRRCADKGSANRLPGPRMSLTARPSSIIRIVTSSSICSSDGRRRNRMVLQSHPPSDCQQFNEPRSHVETVPKVTAQ